jgi:hypothetical protein
LLNGGLSTLTQYLTWFGKTAYIHGRESILLKIEKGYNKYMEEDHSTPSSHTLLHMAAGLLPMAAAPLSLLLFTFSHTLCVFTLLCVLHTQAQQLFTKHTYILS